MQRLPPASSPNMASANAGHGISGEASSVPITPPALTRAKSLNALSDLAALNQQRPPRLNTATPHPAGVVAGVLAKVPPKLHELIGVEKARDLDTHFGSLQPVRAFNKKGQVSGVKDWERDQDGKPLTNEKRIVMPNANGEFTSLSNLIDIEALKRREKNYLWAAGALGRVFIGEEEPVEGVDPETNKQRFRAHPTLLGGGPARICGELRYDASDETFVVNNKSGRYSRYEDRNESHLHEVAQLFSQAGLKVKIDYVSGKKPEPLILPSLDSNFQSGSSANEHDEPK
jgi:hypothetical protein